MASTSLTAYSLPSQIDKLPIPAWKPLPKGRLRQVRVRYGKSPVPVDRGTRVQLPIDAWAAFKDLRFEPVEVFRVAFLDSGNRLMAYEDISRGTVSRTIVHPREVFYSAVHLRAHALIAGHNHPNGSLRPSLEDEEVTRRLQRAGEILGIKLLDHLVIGERGFYSFKDHHRI